MMIIIITITITMIITITILLLIFKQDNPVSVMTLVTIRVL